MTFSAMHWRCTKWSYFSFKIFLSHYIDVDYGSVIKKICITLYEEPFVISIKYFFLNIVSNLDVRLT